MKLYNGLSPNGFRVDAFIAEKEIEIPTITVDVMDGSTRKPDHLRRNSLGEIPVLELEDGTFISESVAICRYLEQMHPEPSLFGKTAMEQAWIEMWNRRMEYHVMLPLAQTGLHEIPIFADKIEQSSEYAMSQRRQFVKNLKWLNNEMADDREFIAGDAYSVADITASAAIMISQFIKQDIPSDLSHVTSWVERIRARKSWAFD